MKKPVSVIAMVFLLLAALLHLLRLLFQVRVTVPGSEIPQWISVFGTMAPAALGVLLRREALKN